MKGQFWSRLNLVRMPELPSLLCNHGPATQPAAGCSCALGTLAAACSLPHFIHGKTEAPVELESQVWVPGCLCLKLMVRPPHGCSAVPRDKAIATSTFNASVRRFLHLLLSFSCACFRNIQSVPQCSRTFQCQVWPVPFVPLPGFLPFKAKFQLGSFSDLPTRLGPPVALSLRLCHLEVMAGASAGYHSSREARGSTRVEEDSMPHAIWQCGEKACPRCRQQPHQAHRPGSLLPTE